MIRDGPPALSDAQLLAVIVGTGTKRRSALAIAETVRHSAGGVGGLARADLTAIGVGGVTAAGVVAALELGRRALAAERYGDVLDTPAAAARVLAPHLAHLDREAVVVALLTRKQRLIAVTPIYAGLCGQRRRDVGPDRRARSPKPSGGTPRRSFLATTTPPATRSRRPTISGPPATPSPPGGSLGCWSWIT